MLLWQLIDAFTEFVYAGGGQSPVYPVLGLDVLLLIYVGWRWWPLIPLSAIVRWAFVGSPSHPIWPTLAVQLLLSIGFAFVVRLLIERLRVSLPLRSLRDIAWFCGILAIAAPIVIGTVVVTVLVAIGRLGPEEIPEQLARFVLGGVTSVMTIVPAVVTFAGWRKLRPPAEHQDPSIAELTSLVGATAVLVGLGIYFSSVTHEPILDLSFVVMAWLAIRYGIRGAALATVTAYGATILMQLARGLDVALLVQTQGFLFAASLMTFLIAGLTDERWDLLARLSRRAFVDELTGLPNRERLIEWIARHQDSAIVLVIVDVDDMRLLNQGVGRVAADQVLQQMAIRLRATFPTSHIVARVSANEFAVAVVDDRSPHAIMTELRAFFDSPFEADGSRVFLSVSMGAVRMIRAGSADEMLRKADIALDHAKNTPTRAVV
ncbi:MAG TPA: diguanylate cyclase, partial [Candidatus Aquilonibacter sp.]